MGSMVEKAVQRSMEALRTRDVALSNGRRRRRRRDQRQALRDRGEVHPHDRAAGSRWRRTCASLRRGALHRERTGAHGGPRGRHRADQPDARRRAARRGRSATSSTMADKAGDMLRRSLTAFVERDDRDRARDLRRGRRDRRAVRHVVPRADPGDDPHARRCPAHHVPDLDVPQPGAHRRPRDEHLRAGDLHGHRTARGDQCLALLAPRSW